MTNQHINTAQTRKHELALEILKDIVAGGNGGVIQRAMPVGDVPLLDVTIGSPVPSNSAACAT